MLIIPMMKSSKEKVYNIKISFKDIKEINNHSLNNPSEINISGINVPSNIEGKNTIELIRHHSKNLYNKVFHVSSKRNSTDNNYVTYQLATPKEHTTESLDNLYTKVLIDLIKNENKFSNGRILDLKKLGLFQDVDDNLLKIITQVSENITSPEKRKELFDSYGIYKIFERCDFIDQFEFEVVGEPISLETLKEANEFFSPIKKSTIINKKYFEALNNNTEVLTKIIKINQLLNGKTLNMVKEESQKTLVKVNKDDQRAA